MIKTKPITNQPLGLQRQFIEDMEELCPVWAWSKRQDAIRKNKKF